MNSAIPTVSAVAKVDVNTTLATALTVGIAEFIVCFLRRK